MIEDLHDELDDFLKASFENHKLIPDDRLWNELVPRMSIKSVSYSKYSKMRNALIGTAASLVGAIFLLIALNTNIFKSQHFAIESARKPVEQSFRSLKNDQAQRIKPHQEEIAKHTEPFINHLNKPHSTTKNQILTTSPTIEDQTSKEFLASESSESIQLNKQNPQNEQSSQNASVKDSVTTEKIMAKTMVEFSTSVDTSKISNFAKKNKPSVSKPEKPILEFPKIDFSTWNQGKLNPFASSESYQNQGKFSFKEFFKRIEIGISASPFLATRSLSPVSAIGNANFDVQYYNNIEKSVISGSAGIDIAFKSNEDWTFITGFHLSNYQQQTQSDALHREVIHSNELMLFTSAGKIPIYGTGIDQLPILSVINTNVSINYFEIPLIARYYWFQNVYIDAGIDYSRITSTKTTIKAEDYAGNLSYFEIAGLNKNAFKTLLGIGFDFKLNKHIQLELGPEAKWQINPLNGVEINTHPLYLGIRTGLRFSLN